MKERTNRVNGLLMLIVYGIFALFSLLLVVVGARVYRNVVSTGHDGALRELYQSADMELIPEMGEKIVEVRDFRIEVTREGNLILHSVDSEGKERSLHLYIEGKTL